MAGPHVPRANVLAQLTSLCSRPLSNLRPEIGPRFQGSGRTSKHLTPFSLTPHHKRHQADTARPSRICLVFSVNRRIGILAFLCPRAIGGGGDFCFFSKLGASLFSIAMDYIQYCLQLVAGSAPQWARGSWGKGSESQYNSRSCASPLSPAEGEFAVGGGYV